MTMYKGLIMSIPPREGSVSGSEESSEDSLEARGGGKRSKKNFSSDFMFSDGLSSASSWDFGSAKEILKKKVYKNPRTSVDDKIAQAQIRSQKKLDKSAKAKASENESEDESDGSDSDSESASASGSSSGSGSESSESESGSDESGSSSSDSASSSGEEDESDSSSEGSEEGSDDEDESESGSKADGSGEESDESSDEDHTTVRAVKVPKSKKPKKNGFFEAPPTNIQGLGDATNFEKLNLSRPVVKALQELNWETPTPIQAQSIPLALAGRDIAASAVTGSGKTGAFLLPVVERLLLRDSRVHVTRVLIVLPTRELAVQCHSILERLIKYAGSIRTALVLGGMPLAQQAAELRHQPDVIVATPGRLIDHLINTQSFGLEQLEILILDEADRLLELGFQAEISHILRACPRSRHTMLFSATFTEKVSDLMRLALHKPVRVSVDPMMQTSQRLVQEFVRVRADRRDIAKDREGLLLALCSRTFRKSVLCFCGTKKNAHRLKILFGLSDLAAAELHGDLTQLQRLEALENFRDGKVHFLLATDLAARGLDIKGIRTVINFTMPSTEAVYVHRVGRTARAGAKGRAVSLVGDTGNERKLLKMIIAHSKNPADCKHRVVPGPVLLSWKKKISKLEAQVKDVLTQEKEEKWFKTVDMEATKASNMITYSEEIANRPARVWFQSEADKAKVQELSKFDGTPVDIDAPAPTKLPYLKPTPTRRQLKAKDNEEDKINKKQYQLAKKRAKALAKLKLTQPGKKRKRAVSASAPGPPEKRRKSDLSTAPDNKVQRKYQGKGHHSFKSKRRHKRR